MSRLVVKSVFLYAEPLLYRPDKLRTLHALSRASHASNTQQRQNASGILDSPYSPIPIPELTLPEVVWRGVEMFKDRPAITCGTTGQSISYAQARDSTRKFAWALLTAGQLKKGDVVGILLPNVPEYMVVLHGAVEAGIIVTFINPLYTADEITRQFVNANVTCCITIPKLLSVANQVVPQLANYKSTIVIGQEGHDASTNSLSYHKFIEEAREVQLPKLSMEDVAALPYSSGTTGLPKGVMLTHRNLVSNLSQSGHPDIEEFTKTTATEQKEICFTVLPFFHIYGFNGLLNCTMLHGLHLISVPRFVPEEYVACLAKYKPTVLFVVPSLLLFLASHPAVTPKHLESVVKVVCGAAPATANLVEKFKAKVGRDNINIRQGYGMTESSPCATFPPINQPPEKMGTCGQLVPHTQGRIIDIDTLQNLGPNQSGEILIRGPQVMKGYLNNEVATKETLDDEGWLHTGDVAYYDEDGYFFIVDRTKELIKVKGNQVSPTELENLIIQLPGIADVAVVGIPDDMSGEIPRAFVVRQPGSKVTELDITSFIKPKVTSYKQLAGGVRFVDAIPRNPSGKVVRQTLRAM